MERCSWGGFRGCPEWPPLLSHTSSVVRGARNRQVCGLDTALGVTRRSSVLMPCGPACCSACGCPYFQHMSQATDVPHKWNSTTVPNGYPKPHGHDCTTQAIAPPHTFYGSPTEQGAWPLVAWGCEFDLVIYGTKSLLFKEIMGLHEALGAI